MKKKIIRIISGAWLIVAAATCFPAEPAAIGADEALSRLLDGNAKFVAGKSDIPQGSDLIARRSALTKDQKPFAVVVSCSDSRVPPELIFNVGLGDIFVVRTAGEVVDPVAIGSIEYAVEHLGTGLIIVLGHQSCGAVSAAVSGAKESGNIPDVLKPISLAIQETKGKPGDAVDNAVRANALDIAKRLQSTGPILTPRVQSGQLKIVTARYDLGTGKVELVK